MLLAPGAEQRERDDGGDREAHRSLPSRESTSPSRIQVANGLLYAKPYAMSVPRPHQSGLREL